MQDEKDETHLHPALRSGYVPPLDDDEDDGTTMHVTDPVEPSNARLPGVPMASEVVEQMSELPNETHEPGLDIVDVSDPVSD